MTFTQHDAMNVRSIFVLRQSNKFWPILIQGKLFPESEPIRRPCGVSLHLYVLWYQTLNWAFRVKFAFTVCNIFTNCLAGHVSYRLSRPTPDSLQTILNFQRGPCMLGISIYQNVEQILLFRWIGELISTHGNRHTSCVHCGRGLTIGNRNATKTLG